MLYGLLFLVRPGMPRWKYLILGLGFAAVVASQSAYFAVRTGDPLYRTRISASHDVVDRTAKTTEAEAAGRALDSEGVLATAPLLAPFSAIFVSQKYGLLFLLALPAYALLRLGRRLGPRQRAVVDCAGLGALVTFGFVAVNATILYIVPRYFMVPAAFASVPLAVLAAHWLEAAGLRRAVAALAILAFASTSLLLLYLENVEPMMAEERIVEYVRTAPAPVHIDPETGRRIRYMLIAAGVADRATPEPPTPGSLVATEDGVVPACLAAPGCLLRPRMQPFVPGPGWTEVARFDPPRRAIAGLLGTLGLARLVPRDILKKIEQPGVAAVIYRAG